MFLILIICKSKLQVIKWAQTYSHVFCPTVHQPLINFITNTDYIVFPTEISDHLQLMSLKHLAMKAMQNKAKSNNEIVKNIFFSFQFLS